MGEPGLKAGLCAQDPRRAITKVAQFLGRELSEAALETVTHHTSFESMRDNLSTNYRAVPSDLLDQGVSPFMRKGEQTLGSGMLSALWALLSPLSPPRHHRRLEEPLHRGPERAL